MIPTVVDEKRYTPRIDPEGPFTIAWTGMSHNLKEWRHTHPHCVEYLPKPTDAC